MRRVMDIEEQAETMEVEGPVNEKKGKAHRKECMRRVPSTPSGNLYAANPARSQNRKRMDTTCRS